MHADTPTTAYFDTLGRTFLTIAQNKFGRNGATIEQKLATRVELDIEGNQRAVTDALGRTVMRYDYDMLGNRIHQASMEAGERWMLNDVMGKPIRAWDSRSHTFRSEYDELRRPLRSFLVGADLQNPNREILFERVVYGDGPDTGLTLAQVLSANLRGRPFKHFDSAGVVTTEPYDFKGNLLRSTRQLTQDYKRLIDWSNNPTVEQEIFTSTTRYDALNRPIQHIAPHRDQAGTKVNVVQPVYNEANLLEQVHAWLNQNSEPSDWLDPATANLHAVTNIDYDAKGQRTLIDYGNGVTTTYEYDSLTFRLLHLLTRRDAVAFPEDCPQPLPAAWPGCQVQNLNYTYDPVGNIIHIRDDAQQTLFFRNKRVEPSADYTYDAIYRLIKVEGREHLGQISGAPIPHSHNDQPRVGLLHPGDGNAMGTYIEQYVYDAVGNFLSMKHEGKDPARPGWTRSYTYDEPSLIEPTHQTNRLTSTKIGNGAPETHTHDAHGNMTHMPHLKAGPTGTFPQNMFWDFEDQLQMVDLGGGGKAYYVYDAASQRTRKVWEKASGLTEERIYLGGFEIHRKRQNNTLQLERETLHIMDDKQRIALIETRTHGNDPAPQQLVRFQFGNHLGSASLDLDDQAQIISYEEYTPYGSTSYQAVRSQTETPKRYRYTGKERDEESGLYYYGARYFASWLGRWTSCDPAGINDGLNIYRFTSCNPIKYYDPTGTNTAIAPGTIGTPPPAPPPVWEPIAPPSGPPVQLPVQNYRPPTSAGPAQPSAGSPQPPTQPSARPGLMKRIGGGVITMILLALAVEAVPRFVEDLMRGHQRYTDAAGTWGPPQPIPDHLKVHYRLPGAAGDPKTEPGPPPVAVSEPGQVEGVELPPGQSTEPVIAPNPKGDDSMALAAKKGKGKKGDYSARKKQDMLKEDRNVSRERMKEELREFWESGGLIDSPKSSRIAALLDQAGLLEEVVGANQDELEDIFERLQNHHENLASEYPERASDPGVPYTHTTQRRSRAWDTSRRSA